MIYTILRIDWRIDIGFNSLESGQLHRGTIGYILHFGDHSLCYFQYIVFNQ